MTKSLSNYLPDKTRNHWRSIEVYLDELVAMSVLVLLPIMVADTFCTHYHNQVCDQLPDIQDQQSLTLCWCSFTEMGK
jgi:hypothetical protein